MSIRNLDYDFSISVNFDKLKHFNPELTEEIYNDFFCDKFNFEEAAEAWKGNFFVEDLNYDVKEDIINTILEKGPTDSLYNRHSDASHYYGSTEPKGYTLYLDEKPSDEFIPNIFNSDTVDKDTKRQILERYMDTGDGCHYIEFDDIEVHEASAVIDSHEMSDGKMWLNGTLTVNGNDYAFDYCVDTDEYEVHNYSETGWITGSCYDQPLPKEFDNDTLGMIVDAIYDAVNEYQEEHDLEAPSYDEDER